MNEGDLRVSLRVRALTIMPKERKTRRNTNLQIKKRKKKIKRIHLLRKKNSDTNKKTKKTSK